MAANSYTQVPSRKRKPDMPAPMPVPWYHLAAGGQQPSSLPPAFLNGISEAQGQEDCSLGGNPHEDSSPLLRDSVSQHEAPPPYPDPR